MMYANRPRSRSRFRRKRIFDKIETSVLLMFGCLASIRRPHSHRYHTNSRSHMTVYYMVSANCLVLVRIVYELCHVRIFPLVAHMRSVQCSRCVQFARERLWECRTHKRQNPTNALSAHNFFLDFSIFFFFLYFYSFDSRLQLPSVTSMERRMLSRTSTHINCRRVRIALCYTAGEHSMAHWQHLSHI